MERINWLGNAAPRGIEESFGIMDNYLSDPGSIEANHETFAHDGTIVRSPDVDALMKVPQRGLIVSSRAGSEAPGVRPK